jgi:hypothetical protein
LSSKIVTYIPFSKTEKKLKRKRSLNKAKNNKQGKKYLKQGHPTFKVLEGRKLNKVMEI